LSAEGLSEAVLRALRPNGVKEALRLRLSGGFSAVQVVERLDGALRASLGDLPGDPAGSRRVTEQVHRVLTELVRGGTVRRTSAAYGAPLGNKGPRKVLVDLYRLA
jgi:hypothetical protein